MTISTSPIIKGLLKIELYKFHFTRRYYGNHHYFLFLCLLRCFNSTGYSYLFQSFYYFFFFILINNLFKLIISFINDLINYSFIINFIIKLK